MCQPKQTPGWGGVCRAILALIMIIPELVNGSPIGATHLSPARTSSQPGDPKAYTTYTKLAPHDSLPSTNPDDSTIANSNDGMVYTTKLGRHQTWALTRGSNSPLHDTVNTSDNSATAHLLRFRRTFSSLNGAVPRSEENGTVPNTSNSTMPAENTYIPLNNENPSAPNQIIEERQSIEIESSNRTSNFASRIFSKRSLAGSHLGNSNFSQVQEDVNRTINANRTSRYFDYDEFLEKFLLSRNSSSNISNTNISEVVQEIVCRGNVSRHLGNTTDGRRRREVGDEGCQVTHRFFGFLTVGPNGEVRTSWNRADPYSKSCNPLIIGLIILMKLSGRHWRKSRGDGGIHPPTFLGGGMACTNIPHTFWR